jgi:hypothetical protein
MTYPARVSLFFTASFLSLAFSLQAAPTFSHIQSVTRTTAQAGLWNVTTTWVGGQVPSVNDVVVVNHVVNIEVNRVEQAFKVRYGTNGRILFGSNAQLRLGSDPCAPLTADPTTILTTGTWRIDELRSISDNVLYYYKRGATSGNTVDLNTSYFLTFNANGTGTNSGTGTPAAFTWVWGNPERTKLTLTQGSTVVNWENIGYSGTASLTITEYIAGSPPELSQVRRGKL